MGRRWCQNYYGRYALIVVRPNDLTHDLVSFASAVSNPFRRVTLVGFAILAEVWSKGGRANVAHTAKEPLILGVAALSVKSIRYPDLPISKMSLAANGKV